MSTDSEIRAMVDSYFGADHDPIPDGDTPFEDVPWYVSAASLEATDPPPAAWLVNGLIRPGVTFIAAEPKSGKTWASLEVSLALATGAPAFGRFEVPEPGPVLYVVEEGSVSEVAYRVRAMCAGHGIAPPESLLLSIGNHVLLDNRRWQERLQAAAVGVRAIVVDPLIRMHTANEDRSESMRPVNSFLRALAYGGSSVLVNHHWTKPGESNRGVRLGNRMRGTGDFWALCDSILYLSRLKGGPDVVVESEHRSAVEEPAWSFALPAEQDPEVVRLEWRPGGVEELKAMAKVPAVLAAISDAGLLGISRKDLLVAVGGRHTEVDAATAVLVTQGRIVKAAEPRPDKAGRERAQVVFRSA